MLLTFASCHVSREADLLSLFVVIEVNCALANLHSYAKDFEANQAASRELQDAAKEESNVLLEDDLVDEDDGGW